MKQIQLFQEELQGINETIHKYEFLITHRLEAKFFSRMGKLSLPIVMMILLNFAKKSMQFEINHFFNQILGENTVTKQGFQEARSKVSYTAFQAVFEHTVTSGLTVEDSKLFQGFRLLAADGSTLMLENTDELRNEFGQSTPVKNESYARISMIFDLLNEFVVDAQIAAYSTGERELAMNHVEKLKCYNTGKYIMLMDRGYWKRELFENIMAGGNKFLLRVPSNASKALNKCADDSGNFHLKCGTSDYSLRYFRLQLESGENETLVTNLTSDEVSDAQLAKLYFMRWGIETKYHELKNLLHIENFTAKTVLSVKQDFFATMILSNLVAFAAYEAQADIDHHYSEKSSKYFYKPNRNSIIAALREHMIAAIAAVSPDEQSKHMAFIEESLSQNPIPIRPNRKCPRRKGNHRYNLRKPKTVL